MQPLGLDLGYLLGYEMAHENELKAKGVEPANFDSRRGGSSVFDVPRCGKHRKIDAQKKSWLQDAHREKGDSPKIAFWAEKVVLGINLGSLFGMVFRGQMRLKSNTDIYIEKT